MKKKEIQNLYLNESDNVFEVLGNIPNWITKIGLTLFISIIFVIFLSSFFIKYPDIISASILVTTSNPPINLKSHISGRLFELFVKNNQIVNKNDLLAILENPANYKDVLALKEKLISIKYSDDKILDFGNSIFESNYVLGDLQTDYANFLKCLDEYNFFCNSNYYKNSKSLITTTLNNYNKYYNSLFLQKNIKQSELNIIEHQFIRDSILFQKHLISEKDIENAHLNKTTKRYEYENVNSSIANVQVLISQTENRLIELNNEFNTQLRQYQLSLMEAYITLLGQIHKWEQNYTLIAPANGTISLANYWVENQNVKVDDIVITVVPSQASQLVGLMELPIYGSGKVKIGQKVNIQFDNYPHMEYGTILGIIQKISLVPSNERFFLEVSLPNGLRTNIRKTLIFKQEMKGTAEIITEDVSLLERILDPLKSVTKKFF